MVRILCGLFDPTVPSVLLRVLVCNASRAVRALTAPVLGLPHRAKSFLSRAGSELRGVMYVWRLMLVYLFRLYICMLSGWRRAVQRVTCDCHSRAPAIVLPMERVRRCQAGQKVLSQRKDRGNCVGKTC